MEQLKKKISFLPERRNGACCLRLSVRKSSVCPLKLSFQQPERSGDEGFLLVRPFGELNVVCKFSCDI